MISLSSSGDPDSVLTDIVAADAEQPQDPIGDRVEQLHARAQNRAEQLQRTGDAPDDALRPLDGEHLGYLFADGDVQARHDAGRR